MARNQLHTPGPSKSFARSENWADPYSIDELAVDKKKVAEISSWLSSHRNKCGILLLTGPIGCGKTAAFKCVARSLGFVVREWITPQDRALETGAELGTFLNQSEKFEEYLYSCSRYADLFVKTSTAASVLLVEDYPNIFLLNPEVFHDVLSKYIQTARAPIVFICSDVADNSLNIERELFPLSIQRNLGIDHVLLNPVTRAKLLQALKQMGARLQTVSPGYKLPTADALNEICESCNGDVRYAMLSLQMKPEEDIVALFDLAGKKRQKRGNSQRLNHEEEILPLCGKDDRVGILHAVGRVLYPKWYEGTSKPPRSSTKRKRKDDEKHLDATVAGAKWINDPNDIVDSYLSTVSNFLLFVQENYLKTFSTIESVAAASLYLSDADIMMTASGVESSHEIYFNVAVRGVMVQNRFPHRIFNHVKNSRCYELVRTQNKVNCLTDTLFPLYPVSHKVLMTDVVPYMCHSCGNSLSSDQRKFAVAVSCMQPLTIFCENFRTSKETSQQKSDKPTFIINHRKPQSQEETDELHISEDDSDEEDDEGAENLTMLEAVMDKGNVFDEGAHNLSLLEAAIIEEEQDADTCTDYNALLNDSDDEDILLSQM